MTLNLKSSERQEQKQCLKPNFREVATISVEIHKLELNKTMQ